MIDSSCLQCPAAFVLPESAQQRSVDGCPVHASAGAAAAQGSSTAFGAQVSLQVLRHYGLSTYMGALV
jgi:hypothetical protein